MFDKLPEGIVALLIVTPGKEMTLGMRYLVHTVFSVWDKGGRCDGPLNATQYDPPIEIVTTLGGRMAIVSLQIIEDLWGRMVTTGPEIMGMQALFIGPKVENEELQDLALCLVRARACMDLA